MTKEAQNVEMWAGDDKVITVTVQDADEAAVDITGAIAVQWALSKTDRSTPVLTKTLAGGGIALSAPASGQFTITLADGDTEDLDPGVYYHEAELTDAAGDIATVLVGTFTLNRTVT